MSVRNDAVPAASLSLAQRAVAITETELGLRGMVDTRGLPAEEYPNMPAIHICRKCGRRTCFEGICTSCLERQARSEERLDAARHGYRVGADGEWYRREQGRDECGTAGEDQGAT